MDIVELLANKVQLHGLEGNESLSADWDPSTKKGMSISTFPIAGLQHMQQCNVSFFFNMQHMATCSWSKRKISLVAGFEQTTLWSQTFCIPTPLDQGSLQVFIPGCINIF